MRIMKHKKCDLYVREIELSYGNISSVKMHRVMNECVIYECNNDGTSKHVTTIQDSQFVELARELCCEAFLYKTERVVIKEELIPLSGDDTDDDGITL